MSNTENEVCVWPNVDTHDQWKWKSQWTIKLPSLVLWIYTTFHVFIFTDIWCLHLWSFLIHCHNLLCWMAISSCRGLHFTCPLCDCDMYTLYQCTPITPLWCDWMWWWIDDGMRALLLVVSLCFPAFCFRYVTSSTWNWVRRKPFECYRTSLMTVLMRYLLFFWKEPTRWLRWVCLSVSVSFLVWMQCSNGFHLRFLVSFEWQCVVLWKTCSFLIFSFSPIPPLSLCLPVSITIDCSTSESNSSYGRNYPKHFM